jgi:hypothetical protein
MLERFPCLDSKLKTPGGYRQAESRGIPATSPHRGNSYGLPRITFVYIEARKIDECPIASDELLVSSFGLVSQYLNSLVGLSRRITHLRQLVMQKPELFFVESVDLSILNDA